MQKKITSHITKGLTIALIVFVIDIIAGFAGFKYATWYRWVPSILIFIGIVWACTNFSAQKDHQVTFGNIFSHGFKTTAVVACLSIIFALLSAYVIFPDTKDVVLDMTRRQYEEKGMTEDQINQALDFTKRGWLPILIFGTMIGTVIVGLLASLLGAAVAKKNPQSSFENQF